MNTAPTRIGRYEIVRRLSKSMTDVYLANDTVDDRPVALKLIPSGGDRVNQLILEAERRGAAIQKELSAVDPRMVEVYEYGEADGYFFVAMQYVEGQNLAEVLRKEKAIDATRAATIALEICEQLAKFHSWQATVVHGDIKPSNIHLGPNETVRLLDFGIAKTLRPNCDATDHSFGSPSYCSPERLARSEVDQHSDLWALGATLYEMLSGIPPYQADNTRKLEGLIRSRRPPRALPHRCPRALRAIVSKALAPNAGQRYRSAAELQSDLQAFLEQRPTLAERELKPAWSANATLEAAREYWRKASRTVARGRSKLKAKGAVASFAAGMALWIGGSFGWQALEARRMPTAPPAAVVNATLPPPGKPALPLPKPETELPKLFVAEGDRVLDAYRSSTDNALHNFDWQKAELCLARAAEMGSVDDATLGKLALSRGYATLDRLDGGRYSAAAAAQLRAEARMQFELAARRMPQSPDPHLALARMYIYDLPDGRRASAEFAGAQHLGAVMGPRERKQQADAAKRQAQIAASRRRYVAMRRPRWR